MAVPGVFEEGILELVPVCREAIGSESLQESVPGRGNLRCKVLRLEGFGVSGDRVTGGEGCLKGC